MNGFLAGAVFGSWFASAIIWSFWHWYGFPAVDAAVEKILAENARLRAVRDADPADWWKDGPEETR